MALTDEVQSRLGAQRLVELTNPQNVAATTLDATRLGLAATDAQARFARATGVAFDATVATHVDVGVRLVVLILQERLGVPASVLREEREALKEELTALSRVTGRDRLSPATSSELTPSDEVDGTDEVRPDFDRERFRHFTLRKPAGADEDDR